ncbi:MAG TPA: hypothetical protein VND15_01535 [Candidatus Acidoferrales bacterium]|nr:hypothetical protein [Candidatus Acidoferrales bacterium]
MESKKISSRLELVGTFKKTLESTGFKAEQYEYQMQPGELLDRGFLLNSVNQMLRDELTTSVAKSIAWIDKGVPSILTHVYNAHGFARLSFKFEAGDEIRKKVEKRYGRGHKLYDQTQTFVNIQLPSLGSGAAQYLTYDGRNKRLEARVEGYQKGNDSAATEQMSGFLAEIEKAIN